MKTSERHQLKTNEVAELVGDLVGRFQTHRGTFTWAVVAAALLLVGGGGAWAWWSSQSEKALSALAEAMAVATAPVVPPPAPAAPGQPAPPAPPPGSFPTEEARAKAAVDKLLGVANAYPSRSAGLQARYQAAGLLAQLGRAAEAEREFRAVVEAGSSSLFGRMARLGLAEAQVAARKYDDAIATYKELAASAGDLPADGLLVQLARAYALAGRPAEAAQAYQRVLDENPGSLYEAEVRRELEALKVGKKG